MCRSCSRGKPYIATPWFQHIYGLYLWQMGGYPFKAEDLTPEEWVALGALKRDMNR
jgi:hypothetical protein